MYFIYSIYFAYLIAMDEQHSRSQRKFGAAPFCTSTFLNSDHLICEMNHVDDESAAKTDVTTKAGTVAKSKAKISHVQGMKSIVEAFKDSETRLLHFCTDQSADGMADAELYFRPHWDFRPCYDIWHKVKEFSGLWKTFCTKRTCPRGMSEVCFCYCCPHLLLGPFLQKELQFLFANDLLPAHKFKIHFEFCCVSCGKWDDVAKRVKKFTELWLGAASHYAKKWENKWMKKYLKKGMHQLFCC